MRVALVAALSVILTIGIVTRSGAQQVRMVGGRVLAVADSTPLARVAVALAGAPTLVRTDDSGRFRLPDVPNVTAWVTFRRIGVRPDSLQVSRAQDSIVMYLRSAPFEMAPITATAAPVARERFENVAQTSTVTIDREIIRNAPGFIESDVIRTIQLLPGTIALNDYTVGYHARGGEADQNLIQLDGVPVFNPSHLGGLFSTFDDATVGNVTYLTGGFPAGYGGRLSSVLDVGVRNGRTEGLGVQGQISLISSKLLVEGPLGGTGATYLFAGRRTYADKVVGALTDETLPYYFADGVGKVALPLSSGGAISLTGYWGRDVLDWEWIEATEDRDPVDLEVNWGNALLGLHVEHLVGEEAQFNFHAGVSTFSTNIGLEPGLVRVSNDARLLSARASLTTPVGAHHEVQVGGGVESYRMRYDFSSEALDSRFLSAAYQPRIWSAFIDDQWIPTGRLLLRPGIRMELVEGADFVSFSPRINAKVFLTEDLALTGSAGRYYQALHSLRDHNVPWSVFDFWIGADSVTPVARSDHLVGGFEKWFGGNVTLTVEGYHKTFDNLITFDPADDFAVQGDEYRTVSGNAWGVDVLLRQYAGGLRGWIAYSYAHASRILGDQEFPPAHDRRHNLNIVIQTNGPLGSEMGVRWGYGTPLPYTPFTGAWRHREYSAGGHRFTDFNEEIVASPDLNSARFPAYGRLDVSFRWTTGLWGGTLRPYLQFVNVLNRRNVFLYAFEFDQTPPTRTTVTQLPFIPTFGVEFEF
jgi:hypothetical protein